MHYSPSNSRGRWLLRRSIAVLPQCRAQVHQ